MAGISDQNAAGLVGAAEINSSWATDCTEDLEEYSMHSDITQKKSGVKKGSISAETRWSILQQGWN